MMLYEGYKYYRIREEKEGKEIIEKNKRTSALFDRFKKGQYSLSSFLDAIKYQTWLLRCICLCSILFIKK